MNSQNYFHQYSTVKVQFPVAPCQYTLTNVTFGPILTTTCRLQDEVKHPLIICLISLQFIVFYMIFSKVNYISVISKIS